METFSRVYENFQWVTLHMFQSSWECGNMKLRVNQYMKAERTLKEALQNNKTALEVYYRTSQSPGENEIGLMSVTGEVRFLPHQNAVFQQLALDAKIFIEDVERQTAIEGLADDPLDAYIRGAIGAWKEHAGMTMLNQLMEKRANPMELFP